MYIPQYFEITNKKEIYAFIEANAFGQLISTTRGRLFSTHVPFYLSEDKTKLIAHLAKQNPQIDDIEGQEVLVTLQGNHDYISPSWYSDPGVPTWNYQTTHIYGNCRLFNEPEMLKNAVEHLTEKFESKFPKPWKPQYKGSMLRAIVGLEIDICEIQCKYKLNQNRSIQDRKQVILQLKKNGSIELAQAMELNS